MAQAAGGTNKHVWPKDGMLVTLLKGAGSQAVTHVVPMSCTVRKGCVQGVPHSTGTAAGTQLLLGSM